MHVKHCTAPVLLHDTAPLPGEVGGGAVDDEAALVPPVLPAHLRPALQLRAAGHQRHPRLTRGTSARRHAAHVATWPAAGTARPRVAAMYTSSSCSTRRDACPGHASSHLRTLPLQLTRVGAACPAAVLPAAVRLAHQLHGVAHRVALDNMVSTSHRTRKGIYLFRSAAVDNLETAGSAGLSQEDKEH